MTDSEPDRDLICEVVDAVERDFTVVYSLLQTLDEAHMPVGLELRQPIDRGLRRLAGLQLLLLSPSRPTNFARRFTMLLREIAAVGMLTTALEHASYHYTDAYSLRELTRGRFERIANLAVHVNQRNDRVRQAVLDAQLLFFHDERAQIAMLDAAEDDFYSIGLEWEIEVSINWCARSGYSKLVASGHLLGLMLRIDTRSRIVAHDEPSPANAKPTDGDATAKLHIKSTTGRKDHG